MKTSRITRLQLYWHSRTVCGAWRVTRSGPTSCWSSPRAAPATMSSSPRSPRRRSPRKQTPPSSTSCPTRSTSSWRWEWFISSCIFDDFPKIVNILVHQQAVLWRRSRFDNQSRNEGVSLQGEDWAAGGEKGAACHAILDTVYLQGEAGARLLVKSPNLSEVGSEWAAMEEELAGAGAMWAGPGIMTMALSLLNIIIM